MLFSVFSSICLKDRFFTYANCLELVTETNGGWVGGGGGASAFTLSLGALVQSGF